MMRRIPLPSLLGVLIATAGLLDGAVIYDRMAVVVGKHTIKARLPGSLYRRTAAEFSASSRSSFSAVAPLVFQI